MTFKSKKLIKRDPTVGITLILALVFITTVFLCGVVNAQLQVSNAIEVDHTSNRYVIGIRRQDIQTFTGQVVGGKIEQSNYAKITHANLWQVGFSLTTLQLLTLIILIVIDVVLLIAAIAWDRHRKRMEKEKGPVSTELHEDHFCS